MRDHQFTFVIDGEGVSPNTVDVRDLFDVVKNLEAALALTAKDSGADESDDLQFSLVDISSGSDTLTFALSDKMYKATSKIAHAVKTQDLTGIPITAHPRIYDLQRKSVTSNWSLGFISNGNGIPDAVIRPDGGLLKPARIEGQTTLYGKCDRPGGSNPPTARLRLLSGDWITVNLRNQQMAIDIGQRLYQVIGLEGVAKWNTEKWALESFKAQKITSYEETEARAAFSILSESAGSFWDKVDPEEYVNEIRSD